MSSTKFFLDTRSVKANGKSPLKIAVTHKRQTILINCNLDLLPAQWDKGTLQVVKTTQKFALNTLINSMKMKVDNIILQMAINGELATLTAKELKEKILSDLCPKEKKPQERGQFLSVYEKFAAVKKDSTREVYQYTLNRIVAYIGREKVNELKFEDITKDWLIGLDTFLQSTSPSKNARNIHFRNIRAVFNEAIDEDITTAYPFRRFKIRPVETPKRSLTIEQLRQLFSLRLEPFAQKYLDFFKLIFFLIGINVIDLCRLKEIKDGRVEYYRAKTNRLYSIKVEPEASSILERYKGDKYLLDVMDRYSNHKDFMHRLNENLKKMGPVEISKTGKKTYHPLFPELTSYWARHTWATLAASLEIPKETIAAALGHGGNTVTDIYIDFDKKKIDEANRRVIDYVLYGQ